MKFHSYFGMRGPLLYRLRVTLRNYLKSARMERKPDRFATRAADSIVSVQYPHPSWGMGRTIVSMSPDSNARQPVLVFLDGRCESWKYDSITISTLCNAGFICINATDDMPLGALAPAKRRLQVVVSGLDDICDIIAQWADTTHIGVISTRNGACLAGRILSFLQSQREWGNDGSFVYTKDAKGFSGKMTLHSKNMPFIADRFIHRPFRREVIVRRKSRVECKSPRRASIRLPLAQASDARQAIQRYISSSLVALACTAFYGDSAHCSQQLFIR
jgi:hypothetical protein